METKTTIRKWKEIWFVRKSNNNVINISSNPEDAYLFLRNSLKNEGVVCYTKVPQKDWDAEKVSIGNIDHYA